MFKKLLLVLAFVLLTVSARADVVPFFPAKNPNEGRACTEMWCQEGLMLQLQGSDWPAGEYDFTIALDKSVTHCKGSLPFKTCDGSVTCDTKDVTIGESGCAMPEGHSFHSILSQKTPEHLSVQITRADGKSFSWDSAVTRQCSYPNGKECDQRECCSAVMDAQVEWK